MDVNKFREGIFALPFRRFGAFTQIMIKKLYKLSDPKNNFHDLYDHGSQERVEVKFSTVRTKWSQPIHEDNVMQSISEAVTGNRSIKFSKWEDHQFDCNMNQVKPAEFETLYYGLFFHDGILIFKLKSTEIGPKIHYSDKQHKGNVGEGQFHINNKTLSIHMKYLQKGISYKKLFSLMDRR